MDEDRLQALSLPKLDFDGDGKLTLGDYGDWAIAIVLYPGDLAVGLVLRYLPAVADFLELGSTGYGGTLSVCLSVVFWLVTVIVIGLAVNAVRNLDRRMTAWCTGRIDEALRMMRVARRRFTSWYGQIRRRRAALRESITVAEVNVASFDAAVLRCHADAGEMRVLAADEIARSLRCSLRNVQAALRRLRDYRLIEPAFGTDEGREGHQITRAGQIYLLER